MIRPEEGVGGVLLVGFITSGTAVLILAFLAFAIENTQGLIDALAAIGIVSAFVIGALIALFSIGYIVLLIFYNVGAWVDDGDRGDNLSDVHKITHDPLSLSDEEKEMFTADDER